jgi:hypothetical protein
MTEIRALRDYTDIIALPLTLQGVRLSGVNEEGCEPDSKTSREGEGGGLVFQCEPDFMPNVPLYVRQQASTMHLFKSILDDQRSLPKDPPYKDLIQLITFILRKFFKTVEEEPFLMIEVRHSS